MITAWQANDGTFHTNKADAIRADLRQQYKVACDATPDLIMPSWLEFYRFVRVNPYFMTRLTSLVLEDS